MNKFESFRIDTEIGSGTLEIYRKTSGGYRAVFSGLSGLPHQIEYGRATPYATNIDFTVEDSSYDNLIAKCRSEIEKRDSEIQNIVQIPDQ